MTSLRRLSERRAATLAAEADFRLALLERSQYRCNWCSQGNCELQQHELQRGCGLRHKQRMCWFAVLCLCRDCHDAITAYGGQRAVLLGLAVLKACKEREGDYDLKAFCELVAPHAPQRFTAAEVERWVKRLGVAA